MTDTLQKVSDLLHRYRLNLVTAESCTGGWVAKQITDLAGSSSIFDRGFVTYSNNAKNEMLDVSLNTLSRYGAVSEPVVIEMVEGALKYSHADVAISISGVAGPGGGTVDKPVGMVCFAWIKRGEEVVTKTIIFDGDRDEIRQKAVEASLNGVLELIEGNK